MSRVLLSDRRAGVDATKWRSSPYLGEAGAAVCVTRDRVMGRTLGVRGDRRLDAVPDYGRVEGRGEVTGSSLHSASVAPLLEQSVARSRSWCPRSRRLQPEVFRPSPIIKAKSDPTWDYLGQVC